MGLFDRSSSTNTTNLTELTQTETSQRDLSGNSGLAFSDIAGAVGLEFNSNQSDALSLSSADSHNYNDSSSLALSSADSHNVSDASSRSYADNDTSTLQYSDSRSYVSTDQGALAAGSNLGLAGIKATSDSIAAFAKAGADTLSFVSKVNADSLNVLAGLASNSIDASRTLARDSASDNAGFLQSALSGFGTLAKQNSASADDRIVKIVGLALAAVAAVLILPALFKGGGKAVLA